MKTLVKFLSVVSIFTTLQAQAYDIYGSPLELKRIQAFFVASQQSIGDSYSGALAWSPRIAIDNSLSSAMILSLSPQKKSGEGTFLETSLQIQGRWNFDSTHTVTASVGLQNWTCDGCGTVGIYGIGYVNDLSAVPELKNYVDEGFIRYQIAPHANYTQQIIIGFEKAF